MAEDFRALIEAQKETTRALLKGEQQAEMDAATTAKQHKDKIKSDVRIEAGRKAWQTRQSNKEISAGGAADKEDAQEKASADKKNQGLLKKIAGGVTGMFGKMNEKIKGAGKGLMAMLKTTLLAGFMIALLAFLQSDTWKSMKKTIVEELVPWLKRFWNKTLKPFVDNILTFIKNPSWDTFKNLFSGVENKSSLLFAVAGLALLFAPIRTTMLAGGLLFKGMKGLVGMFGKEGILNKAVRKFTGMGDKLKGGSPEGTKKVGRLRQIASKASKSIGDGLRSVWGKSVSIVQKAGTGIASIASRASGAISGALGSIWSGGKAGAAKAGGKALSAGKGLLRLMGGAARFAGPIGLAITAGVGIIGGVSAGIEEYKKSGDFAKAVKEGSAGALSTLTFGLVSQESFSKAFTAIGDKFSSLTTGVTNATSKAWEGVKSLIPTEEGLKTSFTKLKNDLAPLSKIKLPTEVSFSAIKESVGTMAKGLNDSFANITGIDVSAKLTGIKNGVANTAKKLVSSFENITGLKIPSFDEVVTSVENITGLKVEDFSAKWKQVTASIPQWIKDNIFDPGSGGDETGAGSPMKIFGMEMSFPSLNISFSGMADKIKSLLPEWLTDPVGYIKDLVAKFAKHLSWIPGMGSDDDAPMDPKAKAEALKSLKGREDRIKKRIKKQEALMDKILKRNPDAYVKNYKMVIDRHKLALEELQAERTAIEKRKMGGPVKKGVPYLVGEGTVKPELFVPDNSGMILSAQKTERIMQAGYARVTAAGAGAAGPAIVNAPVNTVNNSQTNTTVSSTELKHPSAILNKVNLAA